ncbi:nuclear mRNA export, poly(A)+RNA binding protein [Rhizophlyctis rosea]|nr:nuclear mRNA export, poly(A)+RNA binding protein [Rhizophlyctis rosea]
MSNYNIRGQGRGGSQRIFADAMGGAAGPTNGSGGGRGIVGRGGGGSYYSGGGRGRGRGGGRGNISDRLGPAAYDNGSGQYYDGDQSMAVDGSGSRTRFNPYGGGGRSGPQLPMNVEGGPLDVVIQGVEGNSTPDAVMAFLNRKASQPIQASNFQSLGNDFVMITCQHAGQISALLKLSGIRYAGNKLIITAASGSGPSSRPNSGPQQMVPGGIIPMLSTLISSRYDPNMKFLNLENVINDPVVTQSGVRLFEEGGRQQTGPVICKLISELCPGVETITFASNSMRSLSHLSTLPQRLPGLVNLSLASNQLQTFRDIEPLNGRELSNLKELVLVGNPFRERALSKSGGDIKYKSDVKTLFPSIQTLDMEPVLEEVQFGVDTMAVDFGLKVRGGFVDSDVTASTVQDFLQKYFHLFDNNRAALASFYEDTAMFSLSVNPTRPVNSTAKTDKAFDAWWPLNRNLSRVKEPVKRVSTMKVGGQNIVHALSSLPATQHPVNDPPEHRKFNVDAFQSSVGGSTLLYINVQGSFVETPIRWTRSFSRAFVIIPSQPGSRAQSAGLPYAIINDELVVRSFGTNRAWAGKGVEPGFVAVLGVGGAQNGMSGGSGAQLTGTGAAGQPIGSALANALGPPIQAPSPQPAAATGPLAPQLPDMTTLAAMQAQNGLSNEQQNQVIEFARHTGLNYQFSLQCLRETGWNGAAALDAFTRVRHQIPEAAFRL